MPPDPVEIRQWLEKADHDRLAAETLLAHEPPLTDVAAFHCQQAVEKLLKAYLVYRSIPFEKTHDLRLLALLCCDQEPAFEPLRERVAGLTAYAVRFRYPGPTDPTIEQVQTAIRIVLEVRDLVMRLVSP